MTTKISIGDSPNVQNSETIIRKTIGVMRLDDGRVGVEFRTMHGQGIGTTTIPLDEFPEALEALQSLVDNPPAELFDDGTVVSKIRKTFNVGNVKGINTYKYKLTSGPGSKPCQLPQDEAVGALNVLRTLSGGFAAAAAELEVVEAEVVEAEAANGTESDD